MIRPIVAGAATYIPGLYPLLRGGTGGTVSAEYCYGVWIKHLSIAWRNGLRAIPVTMAELGPGDSLGVGLAGLLSGVQHYYAFDVIKYAETERNLRIFEELVRLFRSRAGTPDKAGFPNIRPYLDENWFPSHILTEQHLGRALSDERVGQIRDALLHQGRTGGGHAVTIEYAAPWDHAWAGHEESVDLIFSHSVLEHIDDLEDAYAAMYRWLRRDGFMSHQIDFRSHGLARQWNGHWAYADPVWRIIRGKRPYLLNRQPHGTHIRLLEHSGFRVVYDEMYRDTSGVPRERLPARWRSLPPDDLVCSSALIQAVRSDAA